MRRNLFNLSAARAIASTANIRDAVNQGNPMDAFRFNLEQTNRLNVKFRSSGQGASLRLIHDRNSNGQIDAGELVRSMRMGSGQKEVTLPQTSPGTFYLQVSAGGRGANRYQLSLVSTAVPGNPVGGSPPAPSFVDQIVSLTNNFRQQNGLPPVALNPLLISAAQTQSQNMALQDYFDHTSPSGSTPGQRATAAGFRWSRVSENIGAGYTTAAGVVDGWINSAGHRANMLDPRVTQIGVGYYFLATDTGKENWNHYWTQVFAAPM